MRKSQRLSTALAIGLLAYAGRADAANMYADFNAYPSNE